MIFPGSRIWFEGTAAALDGLSDEIRKSGFTGHVVLEFQDSLDLVIISGGEFVKVIEKIGRRIVATKKYREIWGKCQIKPGRLTIFELVPGLASRLKGFSNRRLLCSGDPGSCDIGTVIRAQKRSGLTGFIDGACAGGKGLLELQRGEITACYFSEYAGLYRTGFEAFRIWHRWMQTGKTPYTLHLSDYVPGADNSAHWDPLLAEGMIDVKTPLRPILERLFDTYGRTARPGEILFSEGNSTEKAYYLMEGRVQLSRIQGGQREVLGYYGTGSVLGLSWLNGQMIPPLSGITAENCRLLVFERTQLEHMLSNNPSLHALLIRKVAAQLSGIRRRKQLFSENPRLKDLESAVFQVLNHDPARLHSGLPPGDLFRELTEITSFSLPEMDSMVRSLVSGGRIELAAGRILLQPEEI